MTNDALAPVSNLARATPTAGVVWLVVLALGAALTLLAIEVAGDNVLDADLDVARWAQGIDFFAWHEVLDSVEFATGSPGGVFIWLALVVGFWAFGRPVDAIVMSIAPAIWLPKTIIKEIVASPRPTDDLVTVTDIGAGFGFPSGHMTGAVAVFGILAIILFVRLGPGRARLIWPAAFAALLILASFDRVTSGAHWPSDVLGSLLLGAIWLSGLTAFYLGLRRDQIILPGWSLLRWIRRRRSTPPPTAGRIAGSIASTVYLDDEAGLATKVYRPPLPVRLLYWAAFQSSFPYSSREEALRTAAAVRRLTGLLTKHWTGRNMVAAVTEISCRQDEFHFVTELVPGEEPRDNAEIAPLLQQLRFRFEDAGLPTWQIDPENPHAHTNFIRTPDGDLKIIDLESTLVPLIQPLNMLPGMLRTGRVPTFDDVDYRRLNAYVNENEAALQESLGDAGIRDLRDAVEEAEDCARAWRSAEPNIWGRAGHRLWHWIDWDRRSGPVRRSLARSEEFALDFVTTPLERWVQQGRIPAAEADAITRSLRTDEARYDLRFFGTLVAASFIPGPPGTRSFIRFAIVLTARSKAERAFGRGQIGAEEYQRAMRLHTIPVALFALIPALGAVAYLLAPSMRSSAPVLGALAVDRAGHKVPFRLYYRLRGDRLTTWLLKWGREERSAQRRGLRGLPRHAL